MAMQSALHFLKKALRTPAALRSGALGAILCRAAADRGYRSWMGRLPSDVAGAIAWRNAATIFDLP